MEQEKMEKPSQGASSSKSRKSLKEIIQEGLAEARGDYKMDASHDLELLEDPYKNTNLYQEVFRKRTAYCYVPSNDHHSAWDANHPESPERTFDVNISLTEIYSRLNLVTMNFAPQIDDLEMLTLVHSREHVENVRELCEESEEESAQNYDSIYFNGEDSYHSAVEAAKMTLTMAKLIAEDRYQNGFANVRPPGHHAGHADPNGYCLFNNVAIAAQYLLNVELAERILIIDYDVHHGQGTQRTFYDTDKVLYFSIHRYEFGTFWPNLPESNFEYIGEGKGKGYNINVPLNNTGLTDYDYLAIILNILLPVAYEYKPSIIIVSAGYDSCLGCPEGKMNVTPAFYAHLITLLGGIADGKLLAVLEGGYFVPSLSEAAFRTVKALLNDPCPPLEYGKQIDRSVIDSINNVKVALRPYWKCFKQIDSVKPVTDLVQYDRYNHHAAVVQHFGTMEEPPFPTRNCYPQNSELKNQMFQIKIDELIEGYKYKKTIVGYMVNDEAELHDPRVDQRAQESHRRLVDILEKLEDYHLLQEMRRIEFDKLHIDGTLSQHKKAVREVIESTHSSDYLALLEEGLSCETNDLYWNQNTKRVCENSCFQLCRIIYQVVEGLISYGVGIVRPPGHHAKHAQGGGFCHLNNVVVAANYALTCPGIDKVLILDFDIHHGDGTQELTYNRKDIMYISMHRFDDGNFFPKDSSGNFTFIGEGPNAGYNVNIPFSGKGKMGNAEYLNTWIKVVLPMSYSFNPDLILVSAGFDAGVNDPLGRYEVYPEVFGHMVQLIKPIAPVVLTLEGGYFHETNSLGMVNCVRALLGHPLPMPTLGDIKEEAAIAVAGPISVLKPYWPLMEINKTLDPNIYQQADLDTAVKAVKKVEVTL